MINVQRGKLLRLPAGAQKTVTAHSGTVWVTEPSNLRDVVLGPGESFTFTRPGLVLVEALTDASISFHS
jgi:hypothetical protein